VTRELGKHFISAYKKHRKRGYFRKHPKSHIPDRVSIAERTPEKNERKTTVNWKTDSIISRLSKAALNVNTEGKSRLRRITRMNQKTEAYRTRP